MLPSIRAAPFFSFLKADSYPTTQAFQKTKEPKDQGWHVILCNFHLLVKNNFNVSVVCVCFDRMHVEHMQIGSYLCHKVALKN